MGKLFEKLFNLKTYLEKTTWLGILLLIEKAFHFNIPNAIEDYIATILTAVAGIVLILITPKD